MAAEIRFDARMSDADALMWTIERDPLLRSTILVVWVLDRSPDRERIAATTERATRAIPRLRQRVVSDPLALAPPRWEADPEFDPGYHVRWLRAPGDGSLRALLDLAAPIAAQDFDRARPLWELMIVEGLEGGRAALVMKLHHSLSDGVGLVRMTESMVERSREPGPERSLPPAEPVRRASNLDLLREALGHERRRHAGRALRIGRALARAARDPMASGRGASDTLASIGRMLKPVGAPLSPLMTGRSLRRRLDVFSESFQQMKGAGRKADGSLNDAFVAGVAGGLRLYHERHGRPVEALRMTMPINVREGEKGRSAGNQFAPARFPVPIAVPDPLARMRAIHELVRRQRGERALPFIEDVAGVLYRLPTVVSTSVFGSLLKGIDFVTSNVPGPPFRVYASGAEIERIFGFGPLTGAAVNVTLFSYAGELGIAVQTDRAAVPDAEFFLDCLREGVAEVLSVA
jgi:diacylglycerol O-acyltransferase